ncbi:MAG: ribose 5-phosphate isomerase B [Campylobacterota bacterium]
MKRVYVATDHAGFAVKDFVIKCLKDAGHEVIDLGPESAQRVDYPDFAKKLSTTLVQDEGSFGVLVCGTGIGISIAANKIDGIRAALCHDDYTARLCRQHNDANVLCFGERVVGKGVIESMLDTFMNAEFAGGRHLGRVQKIGCMRVE